MITKILTDEKDLKTFAKKCAQKLDLEYPLSYLKRAKVRAFYNKYNVMVGGYILAFQGPFRVIESLPDEVYENSPWTKKEIQDKCYEVTGLWLDKKVLKKRTNFLFWVTMYKDMVLNNKKYFVYAYDVEKNYLKSLYAIVHPEVIYEGETKVMEGMNKPCVESIEIASVNYIRFGILYGWDYFFKKLVLPRSLANKYRFALFSSIGQHVNIFTPKMPVSKSNKII